jgi:uncharacterized membrane protein YgaE (UPF0421/DUF939 family)
MAQSKGSVPTRLNWRDVNHVARTTLAAIASLLVARLLKLPEAYWAPITPVVVMHATIGDAITSSWQRFVGTALGAVAGALLAAHLGPSAIVFGAGVFVLGLICAILRLDRLAYRFAGITLAIVLLTARAEPPWVIALHRFEEVSAGIAVGLIATAAWPERKAA